MAKETSHHASHPHLWFPVFVIILITLVVGMAIGYSVSYYTYYDDAAAAATTTEATPTPDY